MRLHWTMALTGAALCGLIFAGAARAQTDAPQEPVVAPGDAAAAAPAVAPAPAAAPAADQPAAAADATPAAPRKIKPKKKPTNTVAVTVTNSRATKLVELQAGLAGSGKLRKIAGPLAPGKKAATNAPRGKDCLIDLHGKFDDGQTMDAAGVDACTQKVLNLTE
jgi:hypothetical protein